MEEGRSCMNIALVHDHLNQIGGAEKVLKTFTEMFPGAPIFTILYDPAIAEKFFSGTKIMGSFLQDQRLVQTHFKWFLPLMPTAVESLNLKGYDVVLSDSSAFSKGVITDVGAIHICYCHTPTRYLWSDSWEYIVELHNKNAIVKKFLPPLLTLMRLWDFQAAGRVDEFIANSNFVAKRIKRFYHRDATVIYPPVETDKYALVSVKKKANSNIEFLGEILDVKRKNDIIGHARALIHPQEEDFGITAVESMAAGTPVIAYRGGGALETVEEGVAGMFSDEQCWESLANTIVHFKDKEFNYAKIKELTERFNQERFEREIKDFIENIYRQQK